MGGASCAGSFLVNTCLGERGSRGTEFGARGPRQGREVAGWRHAVPGMRTGRRGRGVAGNRVRERSRGRGGWADTPAASSRRKGRAKGRPGPQGTLSKVQRRPPVVPLPSELLGAPSARDAPKPGGRAGRPLRSGIGRVRPTSKRKWRRAEVARRRWKECRV